MSSWLGRNIPRCIHKHHKHASHALVFPICIRHFANLLPSNAQLKTIYALSTPPGKGGVAVVRVSGPDALLVWERMVRPHKPQNQIVDPVPWKMHRCRIVNPENEALIDDGLAVYFKAPYSYTTHPTLELHIHSGRALITALLSSLSLIPDLRPAEPGEFTRQALLAGRLDLTQVEGLHDLIEADTEVQRIWALGSAAGEKRKEYDALRDQIIHCLAQVEALIDFGEGEEIEEGVYENAKVEASNLLVQIEKHLADNRRGELVRSGIKMAIFGPPNAGKSSLFNYLANRPASIVTSIPGTTRDVLELTLDVGGLPVVVADTAGLRQTLDVIEGIGVERGIAAVKAADISLCVLPLPEVLTFSASSKKPSIAIPTHIRELVGSQTYFFFNKADLVAPEQKLMHWDDILYDNIEFNGRSWTASLTTGEGVSEFVEGLSAALKIQLSVESLASSKSHQKVNAPLITRARHRVHLESACRFLEAFLSLPPEDVVLGAEELRYAAKAIGRITGDIGVEDVLDSLFKNFCIGK